MAANDYFNTCQQLTVADSAYTIYRLDRLEKQGIGGSLERVPYSVRVLLESVLRQCNEKSITRQDVINLAGWKANVDQRQDMPFLPGRVILQDFTGVPVMVDLAAMRAAMQRLGGDPRRINPLLPVDLVIDHSVQVDYAGDANAFRRNAELEFQRNRERYEFLHWGQKTFQNFRVVPPSTGIVHQVNLEYLANVVLTRTVNGETLAYPDTVVGTDSHTTMINGLGVVGWGVGGIEAVAAMLEQPVDMLIPDVIGVRLSGYLNEGVTPTDLTLTITQALRKKGVVGKFVEFFGPGLNALSLADRAMVSNMAPEYGATISFFPIDQQTLEFLRLSGRDPQQVKLVEKYCKIQNLFRTDKDADPEFTDVVDIDMGQIEPSLAGPKRPQDRVALNQMKKVFSAALSAPKNERGYALKAEDLPNSARLKLDGQTYTLSHGAVVLAAITSCTNTSNPFVMLGAGLLAKKAVEKGLRVKPYIKTSLAPGSRVVTDYLEKAGLIEPLAQLGFNLVGYGCTTCIGNSGPLHEDVVKAIKSANLVAAAVLSGNRNFEGRVSPHTLANYLASPPLVVAYALAGTVDIDLDSQPLGQDSAGKPVYLRDIMPTRREIVALIEKTVRPELFKTSYAGVFDGSAEWNAIQSPPSELYNWQDSSTYIQEPPYFVGLKPRGAALPAMDGARVLAVLGDSITTDHISPAGDIPADSPAGKYLISLGVPKAEFNSYGARRGNDRVMTRGTFANIRLKNLLLSGVEGGYTRYLPTGEQMSIYDAAMQYRASGTPLIILAGKEYGTGSSRDWAAKGVMLLGVRAVLAESYERIHRSNLVGMGVLPLQFLPGDSAASLGLSGRETFSFEGLRRDMPPRGEITVTARAEDGSAKTFNVTARLDTALEIEYLFNGGILHTVLYNLTAA